MVLDDLRDLIRGREQVQALPARIRQLLTDQDAKSERLIGWMQLLLVCVFGTLFALAPRPVDIKMGIEPVPLAVSPSQAFMSSSSSGGSAQ